MKHIVITIAVIILSISVKLLIWKDIFACPFYSITGLYCPGCGGIRCTRYLVQGDILSAFKSNSLLIIIFAFIPFIISVFIKGKKEMILSKCLYTKYLIFALILISVFAIVRNIPHYPFTIFKP